MWVVILSVDGNSRKAVGPFLTREAATEHGCRTAWPDGWFWVVRRLEPPPQPRRRVVSDPDKGGG